MTDKEFVLSIYPNAVCRKHFLVKEYYLVSDDDQAMLNTYSDYYEHPSSELAAWERGSRNLNKFILDKLEL